MSTQNDLSKLFEERQISSLEGLTVEEREQAIFDALVDIEVGEVDPNLAEWYSSNKVTPDLTDRMRVDLAYWDRLHLLRAEGRMTSVEELRSIAKELSGITDTIELWKRIMKHGETFSKPKE